MTASSEDVDRGVANGSSDVGDVSAGAVLRQK